MKIFGSWTVVSFIRFVVQFAGLVCIVIAEIMNRTAILHKEQKLTV